VILAAATDPAWVEAAVRDWQVLLLDHANCEKKAASTALALLFAYPEDRTLTGRLSRLAREELRHFEQVERMLARLGVAAQRLSPGRYASELRRCISTAEPQRKLDLMLCGALIEARSCERFELLAARLQAPLAEFYGGLAEAERRHAGLYLQLAEEIAAQLHGEESGRVCAQGLQRLAAREAELATGPDEQFRFHSGTPA
jgi:tRNA 2-(methylsulfanyl)-N6-isopentenyladenosine37 hydroxylase